MLIRHLWTLIAIMTAVSCSNAFAIGPGFDCSGAQQLTARIICSSPALERIDLAYAQAYYALRHQLGPTGSQALKQEAINFERRAAEQCGIPVSGSLPEDVVDRAACLSQAYEQQRLRWLARLTGSAAEEAARPVELHLALQRQLQLAGLLPTNAMIDGVYGPATRTAISIWQRANGRPDTGFISDADAEVLMRNSGTSMQTTVSEPATADHPEATGTRSEMIGYGSKAGMEAPVVSKSGIGTAAAVLKISVGWSESVRFCNAQYDSDEKAREDCLASERKDFRGPRVEVATANCETGQFTDFEGRNLVYAGERHETDGSESLTAPVITYEGFELPDYGYMGLHTAAREFKTMCPAGRALGEPLPVLELPSCTDQALAERAAGIALDVGFAHMMNVKAIEVWNPQSMDSDWNEVRCKAHVTLNIGRDAMLFYRVFPRRGKQVIESQLE